MSHCVFYWLGSGVGEIKKGRVRRRREVETWTDSHWLTWVHQKTKQQLDGCGWWWLMVTAGPAPPCPLSNSSVGTLMDSGATPFIPLSYQWVPCHPQSPSVSNRIERSCLKRIHRIQWQFNSTTNEAPRVIITVQHPLGLRFLALTRCKYIIYSQQWQ